MFGHLSKGNCALLILAVLICSVVFVGEYASYGHIYHYDASADDTGNYSVYDSGTHCYSAVLTDDGSYVPPSKFYVYYDEAYGSVVHEVTVEVGAKALTQDYYLSQLVNNLKYFSVTDVTYVNAEGLSKLLSDTSDASKIGLVMISGAIPSTVYSGSSADPIITWIKAGGNLYWAGEYIGKFVGESDGKVREVSGYEALFTGISGSLNSDDGSGRAYSEITSNAYCKDLSLKSNNVKYAVNPTAITADNLAVGYTENGYASTCLFKYGEGQICVFGGDYSNNQRSDMAAVIASGLCYESEEISCQTGVVTRGSVNGSFADFPSTHGNLVAFIYLGGDFSVYGKPILIEAA